MLPLAQVGVAVTRRLAARYGRDRTAAEDACAREAQALLGTDAPRGWRAGEALAWRRWSPLVTTLPGVAGWPPAEKAALVEVMRAKGGDARIRFRRTLRRPCAAPRGHPGPRAGTEREALSYDQGLAGRTRRIVGGNPGVTEKRMFGGAAFMLRCTARRVVRARLGPNRTGGDAEPSVSTSWPSWST